ncbi:MAG: hypothetical protein HZC47_00665 [Methanobacterium sp.]|uniref:hypothetical protein n=1 Tax=Methanobacterium sp. TaxID=2164 RepID=UPI003D659808|nr:hypothetical protein [Methanobacterium sp.]
MKGKEILLIIVFYLLVIGQTIKFFYFPNSALSIIRQDFLPYVFFIKIIMILIVFSLIPSFYVVRKAFKEKWTIELENNFIKLIMGFSVIPPLMALINNFTGDILFSAFLLVYGVIFTVIAYRFRDV